MGGATLAQPPHTCLEYHMPLPWRRELRQRRNTLPHLMASCPRLVASSETNVAPRRRMAHRGTTSPWGPYLNSVNPPVKGGGRGPLTFEVAGTLSTLAFDLAISRRVALAPRHPEGQDRPEA